MYFRVNPPRTGSANSGAQGGSAESTGARGGSRRGGLGRRFSARLSAATAGRTHRRADSPPAKRALVARYKNYVPEEETIRNDYSQRYVDGREWPQNWVLGADPDHPSKSASPALGCVHRANDPRYPKQQRLLALKKVSVNTNAVAPSYLPLAELAELHPAKFDVILLDPPFSASFTWAHLQELPAPALAADPSFIFIGCEVLSKWGYRRYEDVIWVRTNKTTNRGPGTDAPTSSLLTRRKQHCLIGIRGTVRWEGDAVDPTRKPPEIFLGMRRREVFGRALVAALRMGHRANAANGRDGADGDGLRVRRGAAAVGRRGRARGLLMRLRTFWMQVPGSIVYVI
ncbi:hypothetical protein FB451DRAFT_1361362 [Mycena latifolia]|nr:hypothetical protein FB451DRAFT_1361362 [Mycena latifolia]